MTRRYAKKDGASAAVLQRMIEHYPDALKMEGTFNSFAKKKNPWVVHFPIEAAAEGNKELLREATRLHAAGKETRDTAWTRARPPRPSCATPPCPSSTP